MAKDKRERNEAGFLKEALGKVADTEEGGYLGDPDVVDGLLRRFVYDAIRVIRSEGKPEQKLRRVSRRASRLARVFLGKNNTDHTLQRGWNREGVIDVFVAKWCGSSETNATARIEHGLLNLVNDVMELADYAGDRSVLPEQWEWQLDAVMEKYVQIFMGVSPPNQALL